jgi:pSer/pThr/pTyr-binding forkhead associated (FHA) protein
MPILTLKFKDNTIADYRLEQGKSMTIGRRSSNDVVIENLAVSGHHAKIDSVGDGFVLTDLQSKNGCFVNEQLVTSHWLKHGDVINIGKHTLGFTYQQGEPRPPESSGKMDQTMVMDTSRHRDMLAKSGSETLPEQTQETALRGVLTYLSGGEGEVDLAKKLIKIGKDSASDIVVSGLGIGQTAATISSRPDGFYLSYVGGLSKLRLNGEVTKESVKLKEFDVIELGSAKMQFFTKEE